MALMLITNDGCVLDHSAAVAATYRKCSLPALSSTSGLSNYHETERTVTEHTRDTVYTVPEPIVGVSTCATYIKTGDTRQNVEMKKFGIVRERTISIMPQHVASVSQLLHSVDSIPGYVSSKGMSEQTKGPEKTLSKTDQSTDFCGQNETSLCMNGHCDTVIRDLPRNLRYHQTENKARHENPGQTGEIHAMCNKISNVSPAHHSRRSVSLALKHGFFAVKVPYMMDSQFEKVDKHFAQIAPANSDHVVKICLRDVQQVLSTKRKRKKTEILLQNSEEEKLHEVYLSLTHTAREQGIFLQHIPLPLDNNVLSRQLAQLDHHGDVFNSLLVTEDGQPVLHMGDCAEALEINPDSCTVFSAPSLIHRKVSHPREEASVVSMDGTDYLLPSCCHFLLSNLEDFCDHLYLQLDENFYDLIVLDPPWENKSVKRKRSYDTMSEDELLNIPVAVLGKPGSLVALWVTNNDRLEDYAQNTLFPAWGIRAVARWHWVKVTQSGHLISSMEVGHKKPYEVLLLGRLFSESAVMPVEKEKLPEAKVIISVPCSLHSKKPPLGEVLQSYLPPNPQCLELFARNLWPGWTSWGREAIKHQNMMFYEEVDSFSPSLL